MQMEGGNAFQESRKCLKTSVTFNPWGNGRDYINKLPDDILILILDKLPMEDAWSTCFLAKRWVSLWRYRAVVEFDCYSGKRMGGIVFNAAKHYMDHYLGRKIQRLSVCLRYDSYMRTYLNSWMMSAFDKNVEEICIDLNGLEKKTKRRNHSDFRLLPDCEIKCSTLVKLTLKFMKLPMLPTCITALKELYLEEVELAAGAVKKITMDCPSLVLLSLSNCNVNSNLIIEISPKCNILKLIINEMPGKVAKSTELYLQAPSVAAIEFASALPRRKYHVKEEPNPQAVKVGGSGLRGRQITISFSGLLQAFWTANVLCLNSWCIQELGLKIMFQESTFYSSAATHVALVTGLRNSEVIGLVYLLKACKGLKKLTIMIAQTEEAYNNDCRSKYAIQPIHDYTGNKFFTETKDLPGLEVLEFKNHNPGFMHDMHPPPGFFVFDENRFLSGTECGAMVLSLLKAKAKNLRKLVFETSQRRYEMDPRKGDYSSSPTSLVGDRNC